MSLIAELRWRGLIQDITDEKAIDALGAGQSSYVGIDPTAPSLQLGNLIPLIVSVHLGKAGLTPMILFGGATGSIGDPSGRSQERQLLDRSVTEGNVKKQQDQVSALFSRLGVKASFVNNFDWTHSISILDFLRDIGKHFTVNYMLSKDVVSARLAGEGISFTEFSYMLLQAADYLHLYQTKQCRLQVGGSDQWGNITAGLELIRKKGLSGAEALSWPLITDSQGKKFGKSAGGAIWLDPQMTSPYKFHQFWLNIEDADVVKYLKIFTFLSHQEIEALEAATKSAPEKREAQKALADYMTTLIHGEQATADAKRSAEVLFGGSLEGLSAQNLEEIFSEVPSSAISRDSIAGMTVIDLFAGAKLASSKGEAKRLITAGGAYINNQRISDVEAKLAGVKPLEDKLFLLRSGKKNYHLVKVQ